MEYEEEKAQKQAYIREAKAHGKSTKEIAHALGHTASYIYQLHDYGGARPYGTTKREVRERDGNRCTLCSRTTSLHVHHVNSPRNHKPSNLITFCTTCHGQAHRLKRVRPREQYHQLMKQARLARQAKARLAASNQPHAA